MKRRLFDQILWYDAYFPFIPLLSECILGPLGQKFPYVVNQAVQVPLNGDLDLPPQGKPIHYLTDTNVRKYRFDNGDAAMIDPSPLFAVDLCSHGFSQTARNTPPQEPSHTCVSPCSS